MGSFKKIKDESKKMERVERMADALAGILATKNNASPSDLKPEEFDQDDIDNDWAIAYALAKVTLAGADD